jgi:signal transduction histidine kinase
VAAVAWAAAAKEVRVTVDHALPPTARFDPGHLARAIDNLLDNAVRHVPRGGRVVLQALRGDAGALLIRVEDDGPGVPDALVAQLFEPFATGRADGTGLGLALAREVALAHGGDLRHVALRPGTRFEMELPWHAC